MLGAFVVVPGLRSTGTAGRQGARMGADMQSISFEGQVAVVTGGGGGIGRLLSLELARRGASVVVNDVGGIGQPKGPSAMIVADEIVAAGGTAVGSTDTVATPEGGEAIVQTAVDNFGTVDAVIHLAGTWRHYLFEEMTPEHVDEVIDVHLLGGFNVCRPAYRIMKDKGYGRIVLCSSSTGTFGRRFGTNYAAGKAGLLGLGRVLSLEGKEHGVFTNCLLPIATSEKIYEPERPPKAMWDDLMATGMERPLPAQATAERLVPLPTYLASNACTVSGEAFSGGAGRYARVFIGVTEGWLAPDATVPTAEDIAANLDQIEDRSSYLVPENIYDELRSIAERIAARDGTDVVN
jgi:NAD(P)-dependent dehydrogenase (short-subunit alcohol dehydrogenase family)